MSDQTRNRVVGGVFLLAIVAIVAPMLFDGAGVRSVQLQPLEPGPAAPPRDLGAPPEGAFEDLDRTVAEAKVLREAVDQDQFRVAGDQGATVAGGRERAGEPGLAVADEVSSVWAVQVASFASQDNARTLRSALRERGYEAFLSDITLHDEVLTRVAVGPYLSEQAAVRAQNEIRQSFELDAQVVAMVI